MPARRLAPVEPTDTRSRLVSAAFDAFAEQGFDRATIDDIADRAEVSRRTFFRHFRSKEDVIFPDHDRLLGEVGQYLTTHRDEPPLEAVCAAVRIVFDEYVRNRAISVRRYALTRSVPALRERELAIVHAYQRTFIAYLRDRGFGDGGLDAEMAAASVVAVHNASLREWLRSDHSADPFDQLDTACEAVRELFRAGRSRRPRTAIAVFTTDTDPAELAAEVRRQLAGPAQAARPKPRRAATAARRR